MRCLILAGGFGKRLWPLTEHKAKALLVVNGEEIITSLVKQVPEEIPISVSTNRRFERDFGEWKGRMGRHVEIFVEDSRQEKEKLGAVSAVSYFLKEMGVDEDLFLLAGDNLFPFPMRDFLASFRGNPLVAVCDVGDRAKASRYGVVEVSGRRIVSFEEKPSTPSSSLVSTACYVFPSSLFGTLHEFCATRKDNLGEFISFLVSRGEVDAFQFSGAWFDVGSLDSYLAAQDRSSSCRIPASVTLKGESEVRGSVYLGERCLIVDSRIEDSIVMDDCIIENSTIRNCILEKSSIVRHVDIQNVVVRGRA